MTIRGAIIDVDGTIVRGNSVIRGAPETIDALRSRGIDPLFVSNNPTKSSPEYIDRLKRLGFRLSADELLTAGSITADFLTNRYRNARIYVIGSPGLVTQLRDADLRLDQDPSRVDLLVASIDRQFDYQAMTTAMDILSDDETVFVGTDPDRTIPIENGRRVPGSGAIIHAIVGVSDREPDHIVGKPSQVAIDTILERIDLPPEECVVIGDRLDTDIEMGRRAGMTTVLVQSGIESSAVRSDNGVPDHVIGSISELESTVLDH